MPPGRGRLAQVLRRLIASLPRCDDCDRPATCAYRRGEGRWCDEHNPGAPDYPRAEPLRDALEALASLADPEPCSRGCKPASWHLRLTARMFLRLLAANVRAASDRTRATGLLREVERRAAAEAHGRALAEAQVSACRAELAAAHRDVAELLRDLDFLRRQLAQAEVN